MITTKRMRALEINSEALGVPTLLLMENAGRSVKDEIVKKLGSVKDKSIYVFIGHGGKGGDGLVAARHLAIEGAKVTVILLGENKHKDALLNLSTVQEMDYSINIIIIKDPEDLKPVEGDILIDALLGTGFSGKPREPFRTAIKVFNASKGFKVSIDVPSGVDSDTGEAPGDYVIPNLVVTFHDMKAGLSKFNFETKVENIGIPPEAEIYVGPGDLMFNIKKREMKSRKGAGGRVLIIGGSKTFSGAPSLSGLASLRTGADLVYVASPGQTAYTIASYSPDLIAIKLSGENINSKNLEELKPWIEKSNAVVIGPGMGLAEETVEASKEIVSYLKEINKPAVIDADALKAIKGFTLYPSAVITPHAGEFKIFFGYAVKDNPRERITQVINSAKNANCVVLLKGYFDVISDGTNFRLNKTGNPGMTVGGTGDTLTGIVATLMAQGLSSFDAASIGAFINGLAGSLAYAKYSNHITPSDLIDEIPEVINNPLESFKKKPYVRVL
ncbi:NAD(P)H-hydrate dehydratase [Acidianus sp. HS-5]|uniref:NAD(P)H-hydrate dehydratase n=1 Tax=Acidianus sp. HS-5 TaxID=2886040 RepID=UPI001F01E065|nr:NAD(P)H-hydrate dehydratase [Acidianus sp. HS-5]BDC18298.1 bifunctional ADP-dependent NAD(P)H-hydrate dehydratase/NAD(P)H-hydrate epimerase [Acidianus sp. HS-5]